ncbi:MAG: hypothetical protein Q8Q73_10430 [Stagnimonas sp.]|nr:hypothetical protein [Stagnimonas sp.]
MTIPSRLAALTLLLTASLPAQAKVLDVARDGFTLENSVTVPVDAMTAWKALVNDVGQWWPAAHTWSGKAANLSIQAQAGGCFCEIDGGLQVQHMSVSFVQPGKLLRMLGGLGPLQGMGMSGTMEWRLAAAKDGGTTITLWYRAGGYTPDDISGFVPVIDKVQGQQLGGLGRFLSKPAQ